ncbi:MAG: DegQ family serine endoprotease [Burkholderiales bacterium]
MMHSSTSFVAALVFATLAALPAVSTGQALSGRLSGLPDFTELYDKQGPAVVAIDVTQKVRRSRGPELSEDDPFYEFFRRFGQIPRPRGAPDREFDQQSVGSGFIISSDGYLITNAHVVDGADEVTVKLTDKREFKAKVVGADKRTDVALLKIEAGNNLPKVTIGDPEKLRVGEWVVAIGKPFGLENTITAGIVSAKGRDLPQENLVPFIQTDAAVNPGNSGGPLFNLKGEVIGINSMIFSRTGGYMGLSFAIPIDLAMNSVAQLKEKGRVTRGRIGVQITEVSKETAESFGLPRAAGALVNSVEKGGPAEKAGVEAGDIVIKADGKEVRTSSELPRIVTMIKPGNKVMLTVWRKGAQKEIAVTVAEIKEDAPVTPARRGGPAPKEKAKPNRLGLVLSDLTDEQRKDLDGKTGVLIEDVSGSVRGNVQAGDVMLAIVSRGQTTEAKNAEQVNGLLTKMEKGASVTFRLRRGEQEFFATLKINNGE